MELMSAIIKNRLDIVKELVKQGYDVNLKHERWYSKSAIMYACQYGNLDIVKCLVEEGNANLELRSELGMSCLSLAVLNNHLKVVQDGTQLDLP